MAGGGRRSAALLALAAAALFASWSPASAPLGLGVGIAAAALCIVERRREGAFAAATRWALALSLAAVLASAVVLGLLVGVGRSPEHEGIVDEVPPEGRREALDKAAARTKPARDAARKELEQLGRGR